MDKAIFAAGCFWGVEAYFRKIKGVSAAYAGYIDGTKEDPSYREVCMGTTGHAEAVEVHFDPTIISYEKLCQEFWQCHNPTTLNRQGPDVGSQYRSGIYTLNDEQRHEAHESRKRAQKFFSEPIVTEIKAATTFWKAEEYHQKYFEKNGGGCKL